MTSLGLGHFDSLFEPGPATVPGYLVLLNLNNCDAQAIVRQVRSAAHASGSSLDRLIATMLSNENWRVQIVGATAALLASSKPSVEALWSALDRPCWASPQLAAVASRIDPNFALHAHERLESGCQMHVGEAARMSMIERHSALGPLSLDAHSAKLASALAALCLQDEGETPWIADLTLKPDIKAAIDADADNAASIALRWREKIDQLMAD